MTQTDRNELYRAYEEAQSDPTLSPSRLNRGFQLAQSDEVRPYDTTESACTCPDHLFRNVVCKHMMALRLKHATIKTAPAPLPTSPAEVSPDTGLADLRRIRARWIEMADRNGDFDAIFQVMHEYGVITTAKTWIFKEGSVTAKLQINGWRASDYTSITVEVDGHVVCRDARPQNARYALSNPPVRLFVPGAWMEVFRKGAQAIQQREVSQRLTAYEAERRTLLSELCIPQQ